MVQIVENKDEWHRHTYNYVFALCVFSRKITSEDNRNEEKQKISISIAMIYINFLFECLSFDKQTECSKTITKKRNRNWKRSNKNPRGDKRITLYKLYLDCYFFPISFHNRINKWSYPFAFESEFLVFQRATIHGIK